MPDILVTIPIPTRGKIEWLLRALQSFKDTASEYSKVQVILKIDDDDSQRIALIPKLKEDFNVDVVTGPRLRGYDSIDTFMDDMLTIAKGKWIWNVDDDSWIAGNWQPQLEKMPMDCGINTEWYCLGGSAYRNSAEGGAAGVLIPHELIKGVKTERPVDQFWLQLILKQGWKLNLLQGVQYLHDGRLRK